MNESKVSITVLMPVYNEKEKYLKNSIKSILNQSYSNFEFLIINDGSTDESCEKIIKEYAQKDERIRIVTNEINIGLTKTLLRGLKLANGAYIARLDSNDMAAKDRLEKQLYFMQNNPDYALCGCWTYIINEQNKIIGKQKGPVQYDEIKKRIITANPLTHSAWFFKKDVIQSMGGYAAEMTKAQDYDLLLRLVPRYPVANLQEFLCYYRVSNEGMTFSNNKVQEKYAIHARLKALREYDYPKSDYLKMIRPLFFYWFVPSPIKKFLMRMLWKI